jgi:hypothetical protein
VCSLTVTHIRRLEEQRTRWEERKISDEDFGRLDGQKILVNYIEGACWKIMLEDDIGRGRQEIGEYSHR